MGDAAEDTNNAADAPEPQHYDVEPEPFRGERIGSQAIGRVDAFHGFPTEDVGAWLHRLDVLAVSNRWRPATVRAELVAALRDRAQQWFLSLPADTRDDDQALRGALREAFSAGPPVLLRARLASLRQAQDESVDAYAVAVQSLCFKISAEMPADERVAAFIAGLRPELAEWVILQEPTTLQDAVRMARAKEASLQYRGSTSRAGARPAASATAAAVASAAIEAAKPSAPQVDLAELTGLLRQLLEAQARGGGGGDGARSGRPLGRPTRTADGQPICFGCGRAGHVRASCPERDNADRDRRSPNARTPSGGAAPTRPGF